ncbi:hypothetical protein [Alkaliphilus transvaalensis]|uniref:hypothetical protein n=1 Tax=Alkaliphilus transvaalensis TaxID=114628 RepID=UPI001FA770E8|nr:hypothetical protein [Alkaliphilus transvaalensis]
MMEEVCPICNGMNSYIVECPKCGGGMTARGAIQDYYDDYSPYLSKEITQQVDGVAHHCCLHIFFCEKCGADQRVPIKTITM